MAGIQGRFGLVRADTAAGVRRLWADSGGRRLILLAGRPRSRIEPL